MEYFPTLIHFITIELVKPNLFANLLAVIDNLFINLMLQNFYFSYDFLILYSSSGTIFAIWKQDNINGINEIPETMDDEMLYLVSS